MLQKLLEEHVIDSKNPYKCYDLAKEYDKLEQGAMAVSLYLKSADLSEDKKLQYKCMIGIARCYWRQRNRGFTVEGAFLDAVKLEYVIKLVTQLLFLILQMTLVDLNITLKD